MLGTMRARIPPKGLGLVLAVAAVAITLGVAVTVWPRHWRVVNQGGSLLWTISRGWSSREVATACGAPSKVGDQPKVVQSWKQFCSAPCELRGRNVIFYDCEGTVAQVETVRADWQGCVLH